MHHNHLVQATRALPSVTKDAINKGKHGATQKNISRTHFKLAN